MTIYDIAKQLKLSPATVSLALNNDSRVALRTREKVNAIAKENGFERNEQARNFSLKRTNTVAVVVYNIDDDFWSGSVKVIEAELGNQYSVIICNTDADFEKEQKIIATLKKRKVDGVIIQPVSADISHLVKLHQSGIPVVLFEKTEHPAMSFVKGDDFLAARNLTLKCIAAGHERIAFVFFTTNVLGAYDRINGFRSACEEKGIMSQCQIIEAKSLTLADVNAAVADKLDDFTLAICSDDRLACLLMRITIKRNINVPDDLSIIGWNNSKFLDYMSPPLTSISIPVQAMGSNAAQIILRHLNNQTTPVKLYLEEEITYRESFKAIKKG